MLGVCALRNAALSASTHATSTCAGVKACTYILESTVVGTLLSPRVPEGRATDGQQGRAGNVKAFLLPLPTTSGVFFYPVVVA